MGIPTTGWRPMSEAPKDGTIIAVRYSEWGKKDGPKAIQFVQYLCDHHGMDWRWREPWRVGITSHADAWMPTKEFFKLAETPAAALELPAEDAEPEQPEPDAESWDL